MSDKLNTTQPPYVLDALTRLHERKGLSKSFLVRVGLAVIEFSYSRKCPKELREVIRFYMKQITKKDAQCGFMPGRPKKARK